ncbi:MAG TPA: hypothetical protein VD998_03970, partial [Verrucomicrobiae bacterium]|nr:hypothetical protein [Verrucomicrobiae bacterium]
MRRIYIFAWTILISCGIVIYNQIDFNSRNSENNTQNTSSADVPQTSEIDLPQIEKAIASESEVPDPVSIKIE